MLAVELDARLVAPRSREISRRLGRQMLRASRVAWPSARLDHLATSAGGPHQPIVLGVVVGGVGWRAPRRRHARAAPSRRGGDVVCRPAPRARSDRRARPAGRERCRSSGPWPPMPSSGRRWRPPTSRRSAAPSPRSSPRTTRAGTPVSSSPDTRSPMGTDTRSPTRPSARPPARRGSPACTSARQPRASTAAGEGRTTAAHRHRRARRQRQDDPRRALCVSCCATNSRSPS